MKESQTLTATTSEPEYEWGVKYRVGDGQHITNWGYEEDPRPTGVIDKDGEIEVGYDYWKVISVGKRTKTPEVWETAEEYNEPAEKHTRR